MPSHFDISPGEDQSQLLFNSREKGGQKTSIKTPKLFPVKGIFTCPAKGEKSRLPRWKGFIQTGEESSFSSRGGKEREATLEQKVFFRASMRIRVFSNRKRGGGGGRESL